MSRLSRSRIAVATGLTVGTAAAGLLLAPAAFAAATDPYPYQGTPTLVVTPDRVHEGETVQISGDKCIAVNAQDQVAVIVYLDGDVTDPHATAVAVEPDPTQGTWSLPHRFGAGTSGEHHVYARCDHYNIASGQRTNRDYAPVPVTVTPAVVATPAPTPSSSPTTSAAPFVPGAKPNTPGIAVRSAGSTAGDAAAPGQKVVKVLKGFQPREVVTLVLHSTPVTLGTFTADADGVVTAEFTLPAGTPLGQHTLAYSGAANSYFEEPLTLTADGKSLAYTGANIELPLIGGIVLVVAGAGALVLGRRRSTGAVQA